MFLSSIRDKANTQLPAAAVASSNISSLGQQRQMTEKKDKKRAATSIWLHPPSATFQYQVQPLEEPCQKVLYLLVVEPPSKGSLVWMGQLGGPSEADTLPRATPNHNKQVPCTKLCQFRFQFS